MIGVSQARFGKTNDGKHGSVAILSVVNVLTDEYQCKLIAELSIDIKLLLRERDDIPCILRPQRSSLLT